MKGKWAICLGALCLASVSSGALGDYTWQTYSGHQYAITDYGTWAEAEAAAVAAGGHLATINDAAENDWLTALADDCYRRDSYGNPSQMGAWVGYELVGGSWGWRNGEPVTFTNYADEWSSFSGVHAYLLGATYDAGPGGPFPGEWSRNAVHDQQYVANLRGIIEVSGAPSPGPTVDMLEDIGPDGTPVLSRTIAGVEVTMSSAGGPLGARTYYDSDPLAFGGIGGALNNSPLVPSNVSLYRFLRTDGAFEGEVLPISFEFSSPIESFGLTTLDLLEYGEPDEATVEIRAYDASDILLDEMVRTGPQGSSGLDLDWLVSSPAQDIVRVELTGTVRNYCGYGIDDLVLVVPEPATLSLLAVGAGLVIRRRRHLP